MLRNIILLFTLVSANYGAFLPVRKLSSVPALTIPSTGRIVGGEVTFIEEVPYQAALLYGVMAYPLLCGASIVKHKALITSARCIEEAGEYEIVARVGSHRYYQGGEHVGVESYIKHELYDREKSFDYDIAIVILESSIKFSDKVTPVVLPAQGSIIPDRTPTVVSGWGRIAEDSPAASPNIRKVEILTFNQDTCKQIYNSIGHDITPRMLCGGDVRGGKGTCAGDVGGPMAVDHVLVGITSWSYGCARPGYPQVYTRVSEFRNWLDVKLEGIE